MTIEEFRTLATDAMNAGSLDENAIETASLLIREFNFDMAYGGPLARLDEDGFALEDDDVNELCRAFGYAEIAGE